MKLKSKIVQKIVNYTVTFSRDSESGSVLVSNNVKDKQHKLMIGFTLLNESMDLRDKQKAVDTILDMLTVLQGSKKIT